MSLSDKSQTFIDVGTEAVRGSGRLLNRPDVRAALFVSPALLVLGLAEVGSGGVGSILVHPVRTLVYVGQGYLVARFVKQASGSPSDLLRLSMRSAALGWLISFIWSGLCLLVLGAMTAGLFLAILPIAFAAHIVSIVFNMILTPLAARIAYRHGGSRLVLLLVLVAGIAIVVAVVTAIAVMGLLVWIGASLLS